MTPVASYTIAIIWHNHLLKDYFSISIISMMMSKEFYFIVIVIDIDTRYATAATRAELVKRVQMIVMNSEL